MKSFIIAIPFYLIILFSCENKEKEQGTRFSLLSSAESGIKFENTIVDEKDRNILIYDNYYQGSGVGLADFNNDGLTDIYLGGNIVGDRLYINKGNLNFEDYTRQANIINDGSWTSGVVLADVNMDGFMDIYLCKELYDNNPNLRSNKLYINRGDLTFDEASLHYGLADAERSRHASFFDYDNDGDPDLFLLNQPPNPGNYSSLSGTDLLLDRYSPKLYKNHNGKFIDITKEAGLLKPGYCNSLITCDLNNDGWVDIYITNDFEIPDFHYINNGDGTFTNKADDQFNHLSYFSMGVDVADINNNGMMDIMVTDMSAEDNFRQKANMSGMNPDVFWKVVEEGGHYQYMYNTLQLKRADGVYSEIGQMSGISSSDWSWSNFFGDFDNDGFQDLFIANGLLRDMRNTDASKEFPKLIEKAIADYIKKNPNEGDVSIWDIINLKEVLSILPSEKLSNYIYKNNGNLGFENTTKKWGLNQKTFSNGAAYADLDNDGDLDIVVSNINDHAFIYRNNSKGKNNNYLRVKFNTEKYGITSYGIKAKIEYGEEFQIRETTNTRGMFSTSENILHFGLKNIEKVDKLTISWLDGTQTILSNIESNQLIEISPESKKETPAPIIEQKTLFTNNSNQFGIDYTHVENSFDDYESQILLPHKLSNFGPGIAVGDVNADGLEDFFIGAASQSIGQMYYQTRNGNFKPALSNPWKEDIDKEDIGACFFDSDSDGDLDLYVISGGNEFPKGSSMYEDRLYINEGKGNFKKSNSLPSILESGSRVKPFDFDNDGDIDLFIGGRITPQDYPNPTSSRLLRNDNGQFTDVTLEIAPELLNLGMVTDAVWSDFDNDNQIDLIVVGEWMPITIFKNKNGVFKKIVSPELESKTGWWFSIESADIDNDGDDDYIVGNLGLNYKYKSTPEEPFGIHYSDVNDNGSKDIILSYYNFGTQYPLRGRSCSSSQVPEIKEKFINYTEFAQASLSEVYGEESLSNGLSYKVENFASQYMKNIGEGKFEFTDLPIEAQIAPINDIIIDDFDADSYLDLLISGNLYCSEIETPRADAGKSLVLLGDGKGTFKSLEANKSGVLINADTKELARIKTINGTLIIFANNNSRLETRLLSN